MIAGLKQRETRRIFCLMQAFEQRLLVGGGIDRIAATMGKPERQLCLVEGALVKSGSVTPLMISMPLSRLTLSLSRAMPQQTRRPSRRRKG